MVYMLLYKIVTVYYYGKTELLLMQSKAKYDYSKEELNIVINCAKQLNAKIKKQQYCKEKINIIMAE